MACFQTCRLSKKTLDNDERGTKGGVELELLDLRQGKRVDDGETVTSNLGGGHEAREESGDLLKGTLDLDLVGGGDVKAAEDGEVEASDITLDGKTETADNREGAGSATDNWKTRAGANDGKTGAGANDREVVQGTADNWEVTDNGEVAADEGKLDITNVDGELSIDNVSVDVGDWDIKVAKVEGELDIAGDDGELDVASGRKVNRELSVDNVGINLSEVDVNVAQAQGQLDVTADERKLDIANIDGKLSIDNVSVDVGDWEADVAQVQGQLNVTGVDAGKTRGTDAGDDVSVELGEASEGDLRVHVQVELGETIEVNVGHVDIGKDVGKTTDCGSGKAIDKVAAADDWELGKTATDDGEATTSDNWKRVGSSADDRKAVHNREVVEGTTDDWEVDGSGGGKSNEARDNS